MIRQSTQTYGISPLDHVGHMWAVGYLWDIDRSLTQLDRQMDGWMDGWINGWMDVDR